MVVEMVGAALTLQTLIRTLLFMEMLFYIWLGGHLANLGVAPGQIGGAILLIAVLWRLSHALGSYVLAAFLRWRNGRSLPMGNSLAALASEIRARAISYNWSQPFPWLALGADPVGSGDGAPILLVPGFFSNRGIWVQFRRRLAAAKVGPVYTVTLEPFTGSLDEMVPSLQARIEEVLRETRREKIVVQKYLQTINK